jgi:hypothetical protein
VIARFFQMRLPGGSGWELVSLVGFNMTKATVFVGVGHWLHDTPPIFSDRIMRIFRVCSCVGNRALPMAITMPLNH